MVRAGSDLLLRPKGHRWASPALAWRIASFVSRDSQRLRCHRLCASLLRKNKTLLPLKLRVCRGASLSFVEDACSYTEGDMRRGLIPSSFVIVIIGAMSTHGTKEVAWVEARQSPVSRIVDSAAGLVVFYRFHGQTAFACYEVRMYPHHHKQAADSQPKTNPLPPPTCLAR